MKAVIFMVMFYDRGRIQIRVSQGKRCMECGASNYPLPLESWTDFPVPAMTCDNLHRALPNREGLPIQRSYWMSVMQTWLTPICQTLQEQSGCHTGPKTSSFITLLDSPVWTKVPGKTKILLRGRTFQQPRDHLPGAKGKGQTCLYEKLIIYYSMCQYYKQERSRDKNKEIDTSFLEKKI